MVEKFTSQRYGDWRIRFAEFIKDSQDIGVDLILDWDVTSCASWACDCVEAITGKNPHDPFKGYSTPKGAALAIKRAGYATFLDICRASFEEIPLSFVIPGDIVLVDAIDLGDDEATAVMKHSMALADPPYYRLVDPRGLAHGPILEAKHAFAIGREAPCLLQ